MKLITRHIKKFEQFIESPKDSNQKSEKDPKKKTQSEPGSDKEEMDGTSKDEDDEIQSKKEKDLLDELNEYFSKQQNLKKIK
jgi:hypothetical protein